MFEPGKCLTYEEIEKAGAKVFSGGRGSFIHEDVQRPKSRSPKENTYLILMARTLDMEDPEQVFDLKPGAREAFAAVQALMKGNIAEFNQIITATRRSLRDQFNLRGLVWGLDFGGLDLSKMVWEGVLGVDLKDAKLNLAAFHLLDMSDLPNAVIRGALPETVDKIPYFNWVFSVDEVNRFDELPEGSSVSTSGGFVLPDPFGATAKFIITRQKTNEWEYCIELTFPGIVYNSSGFDKEAQRQESLLAELLGTIQGLVPTEFLLSFKCSEVNIYRKSINRSISIKQVAGSPSTHYRNFLSALSPVLDEFGRFQAGGPSAVRGEWEYPEPRVTLPGKSATLTFDPRFAQAGPGLTCPSQQIDMGEEYGRVSLAEDVALSPAATDFFEQQVVALRGFPTKRVPRPFLLFHGRPGAGKSFFARLLAMMINPEGFHYVQKTDFDREFFSTMFTNFLSMSRDGKYSISTTSGMQVLMIDDAPWQLLTPPNAQLLRDFVDGIQRKGRPWAVFVTRATQGDESNSFEAALVRPSKFFPLEVKAPSSPEQLEMLAKVFWRQLVRAGYRQGPPTNQLLARVKGKIGQTPAEIAAAVEAFDPSDPEGASWGGIL